MHHNAGREVICQEAQEAEAAFRAQAVRVVQAGESKILSEHVGEFSRTNPSEKKKSVYLCHYCNTEFHAKVGAMVDHVTAHKQNQYIEVYVINKGAREGCFRPEHHARERGGRWFGGSDTRLSHCILPDDVEQENGKVWCRHCSKVSFPIGDLTSSQMGQSVRFMREHEARCLKKKRLKLG